MAVREEDVGDEQAIGKIKTAFPWLSLLESSGSTSAMDTTRVEGTRSALLYQLLNFPGVPMPKRLVAYDLEAGAGSIDGIECGGKCHVVSNCSFSKLIGPGTRLGWIEAGVTLIDSILASGVLESSGSMNHLSSGIMAHLLGSGAQAAILAELRTTYAARANALCTALKESLPAAAQLLVQPTGGFFVWLLLPCGMMHVRPNAASHCRVTFYACLLQWQLIACGFAGVPAELVIGTAMREDFQVTTIPGNAFSPGKTCGSCLRLAFTMYSPPLSPPTNRYEPQLH